jgi:hypothetical protein
VWEQDLSKVLGPLEAEVMWVAWAAGVPMSVRAVLDFGDAAVAGFVDEASADPKLRARLEPLLRDRT